MNNNNDNKLSLYFELVNLSNINYHIDRIYTNYSVTDKNKYSYKGSSTKSGANLKSISKRRKRNKNRKTHR